MASRQIQGDFRNWSRHEYNVQFKLEKILNPLFFNPCYSNQSFTCDLGEIKSIANKDILACNSLNN